METKNFNIAILGGGPAGYVAAIKAAKLGATVALIENRELGGTCLNRGCIPTKALLKTSEISNIIKKSKEYSVESTLNSIHWESSIIRKDRIVKSLRLGLEHLMTANKIHVFRGKGSIISSSELSIESENGIENITCEKLLITTGSEPLNPTIPGIELDGVMNSDTALNLEYIPESIVIIGAGAIGLEFATMFRFLGSKVTVIEHMENILPYEDNEITTELIKIMKRQGIKFELNTKVTNITESENGLTVFANKSGKELVIETAKVLVAVGRKLNSLSKDILALGVSTEAGRILVNDYMETNIENVYAAGDVIGGKLLAHLAFAEGNTAAKNALGCESKLDYNAVPACVYTHPEIASVGLSEKTAEERGIDINVGRFNFRNNGRALCIGERDGLVKVIVDKESNKILGGQILGANASELISEITLAIKLGAKAQDVGDMIHPHPSQSEAVMEACGDAVGIAIHK